MKAVITTIQHPTSSVRELARRCEVIVIGDLKTPEWSHPNAEYISYARQVVMDFNILNHLKDNHYSRKNIGYLLAMKAGARVIYDTDDDNRPNEKWQRRELNADVSKAEVKGWFNIYKEFRRATIWPRGFSLNHIKDDQMSVDSSYLKSTDCPIQQGVSDGEPDVDAIWRLTYNFIPVSFWRLCSVNLGKGVWCPFNSQSTWWFPEAYPLLYLPINVSFRMTDIWRSFVAQRCLWEMGYGVTFHSPAEVYQERNKHDLIKDLEQEVDGYTKNDLIVETLNGLELKMGKENIYDNMLACYQALADINIVPEAEIRAVNAWIKDVKSAWKH